MRKYYVNAKHQVAIACDHCGNIHTTQIPTHIRGDMPVRATCACGKANEVSFEFRQSYRKPTLLRGHWHKHATGGVEQMAQVRNISQNGIKFTTRGWRDIHPDDVLTLAFTLDNNQRSEIDKQVVVKYVDKQAIGAQFSPEDRHAYQTEIGFYLMG